MTISVKPNMKKNAKLFMIQLMNRLICFCPTNFAAMLWCRRCATQCMTTSAPQFKMRSARCDMKTNVKLNMRQNVKQNMIQFAEMFR